MDQFVIALLAVALFHFVLAAIVLPLVFRKDLEEWRAARKARRRNVTPVCMYCDSRWTHAIDGGETRWDNDDLVLVTTYECEHCKLPFWHVERVAPASLKR